jgi:hypothetical protein
MKFCQAKRQLSCYNACLVGGSLLISAAANGVASPLSPTIPAHHKIKLRKLSEMSLLTDLFGALFLGAYLIVASLIYCYVINWNEE